MEKKLYQLTVDWKFVVEATSPEVAKEIAMVQMSEWMENFTEMAYRKAVEAAVIEEIK